MGVKAQMCAVDDENNNQQLTDEYFKESDLAPRCCFPIFPVEPSPQCNEPTVNTSHPYQVSRATMSQPRSVLTEDIFNQVNGREEPACGSHTCHQAEPFTVHKNVSDPDGESSVDTEVENL